MNTIIKKNQPIIQAPKGPTGPQGETGYFINKK